MQEGPAGETGTPEVTPAIYGAAAAGEARPETAKKSLAEEEEPAWKELVELVFRAAIFALLIYMFVFQVSIVEGPSMTPTFHEGDKLVIDKLTYRFANITRFDVVVFEAVDLDKQPRIGRDYIKRVIGLPGDEVEIYDGAVWVNHARLAEPFGPTYSSNFARSDGRQKFVVPAGCYFVMGDNRTGSKDSRIDRGHSLRFISEKQIKGVVRLRLAPWSRVGWFSRGSEPAASEGSEK